MMYAELDEGSLSIACFHLDSVDLDAQLKVYCTAGTKCMTFIQMSASTS